MRIAFYEMPETWERKHLEERLGGHELLFREETLTPDTAEQGGDPEAVSVFINSRVDRAVLDRLPAIQFVATRSTGYDHVDVEACGERGVAVTNVPAYGENTVAEHTFGLILNLSRKIQQAYDRTRECDFSLAGLEGMDLRRRTLGVIGAGRIGLHVLRIGRALGMELLAFDARPQPLIGEVLGFRYVPLEELLRDSDVVSLHTPLLSETRHLMNRERFGLMKRGALLVNTARGALVDTDALLWALEEGIVAGAGLDVLEGEELLAEEHHMFRTRQSEAELDQLVRGHRLLALENVIITPHLGWYSREARQRILDATVESIEGFLTGDPVNMIADPGGPVAG